ncbi:MAG TPA: hypothetical protein VH186_38130 [Chloroflexia bacterium]|nr:hypothetical protein [Chloroflexia bacterium]
MANNTKFNPNDSNDNSFSSLNLNDHQRHHRMLEPLISVYQDGEASPAERMTVEQYLANCAGCREVLEGYQRLEGSLLSYLEAMPEPRLNPESIIFEGSRRENLSERFGGTTRPQNQSPVPASRNSSGGSRTRAGSGPRTNPGWQFLFSMSGALAAVVLIAGIIVYLSLSKGDAGLSGTQTAQVAAGAQFATVSEPSTTEPPTAAPTPTTAPEVQATPGEPTALPGQKSVTQATTEAASVATKAEPATTAAASTHTQAPPSVPTRTPAPVPTSTPAPPPARPATSAAPTTSLAVPTTTTAPLQIAEATTTVAATALPAITPDTAAPADTATAATTTVPATPDVATPVLATTVAPTADAVPATNSPAPSSPAAEPSTSAPKTSAAVQNSSSPGWIAYVDKTDAQVHLVHADGSDDHLLSDPNQHDIVWEQLAWSNDGRWLAAVGLSSSQPDPGIYLLDSQNPLKVDYLVDGMSPSWSPDSRTLAYLSAPIYVKAGVKQGQAALFSLKTRTSTPISNQTDSFSPQWFDDSTRLLLGQNRIFDLTTGQTTTFKLPFTNECLGASLSPSGNKLATLELGPEGLYATVIYDLSKGKLNPKNPLARATSPVQGRFGLICGTQRLHWSPDSRYVYYYVSNNPTFSTCLTLVSNASARCLFNIYDPSFTSDSSSLVDISPAGGLVYTTLSSYNGRPEKVHWIAEARFAPQWQPR